MNYRHFDKIENIKNIVFSEHLKNINWAKIKDELTSLEKDTTGPMKWFLVKTKSTGEVTVESNLEHANQLVEHKSEKDSDYLQIDLTEGTVDELNEIREIALDIPGLAYTGIHFLGPNSIVTPHVDKGTNNFLFHVTANDKCILKVNGIDNYFQSGDLFLFDGEQEHSAYNNSDSDWIMFVLRIKKEFFNYENIN